VERRRQHQAADMADAPVFLYIATYGSEADAQADYEAVKALHKDHAPSAPTTPSAKVPAARVVNSGTTFPWRNAAGRFPAEVAVPAKREGTMSTVRRHIEVEAPPSVALATWSHVVRWIMTGHQRLACDELACVDAVRAGLVACEPLGGGNQVGKPTMAEKKAMIEDEERRSHEQLHQHIGAEDEPVSYQDHFPS